MIAGRRNLLPALIATSLLGLGALGIWQISKLWCSQPFGNVICRVETGEKIVALSFDDGPTDKGVEAVLPVLEAHGVKATFFLIGNGIADNPDATRRIVDAGHEVGNHTLTHNRMIGRSMATYAQEIAATDALIVAAGAPMPRLVRPPYFQRLWGFSTAVERAGRLMVTADVPDRMDPELSPEDYAADILARTRPGSIILLHPMYRDHATVRDALPLILSSLQQQGYRIVTVSDLLDAPQGLASG